MTSFQKNPKFISFAVFCSWIISRNNYVLIVISIVYASLWLVTWPLSPYELQNDQFDHFIDEFIPIVSSPLFTSGKS